MILHSVSSSFKIVHLIPWAVWQFSQSTRVGLEQFLYFDSPKCNFGNDFKAPHPKDFMTSQELPLIRASLGDKSGSSHAPKPSVCAGTYGLAYMLLRWEGFVRRDFNTTHCHLHPTSIFLKIYFSTAFSDLLLRELFPY